LFGQPFVRPAVIVPVIVAVISSTIDKKKIKGDIKGNIRGNCLGNKNNEELRTHCVTFLEAGSGAFRLHCALSEFSGCSF
jgi:hypothetical protein